VLAAVASLGIWAPARPHNAMWLHAVSLRLGSAQTINNSSKYVSMLTTVVFHWHALRRCAQRGNPTSALAHPYQSLCIFQGHYHAS
jgi:hypothetical protein